MRAITLVIVSTLGGLWAYYGIEVEPQVHVRGTLRRVENDSLNNEGLRLARRGRKADALAHFERARDLAPDDSVIEANLSTQRAVVRRDAWERALGLLTALAVVVLGGVWVWRGVRAVRDRCRLRRLRLRGEPYMVVRPGDDRAEFELRFSDELDRGLLRRHPLTIVWSCARHGKHMRSHPPARVSGRACTVELNEERVERLRRYPGEWRGFLYLGKTQVGEAAARVA